MVEEEEEEDDVDDMFAVVSSVKKAKKVKKVVVSIPYCGCTAFSLTNLNTLNRNLQLQR
jgi:CO dehydrogenase/acetyl-CoA synthase epsilon subunit